VPISARVTALSTSDDDIQVRPGRIRHGNRGAKRPQTFVGEVMRAAKKAGHVGSSFRSSQGRSRSRFGRGRRAAVSIRLRSNARRVVMKARVVRHQGTRFRSAPLPKHMAYLKRDGVTRDGADARMFDATSDAADEQAFAERTADDRHHFRFIISPEDAAELADLRGFTRELMQDVERDLGTRLDWVAVDHWNTDNPHVHVLIRGRADDGKDLVISGEDDPEMRRLMLGRAAKLERLGLAEQVGPAQWTLKPGIEPALRDLGIRGDIIKTMHRAMSGADREPDVAGFAIHGDAPADPVLGRLVQRGLDDELKGSAYAIVEGVDGRTHHLRFSDLELTGDARPGAVVEARVYEDANGRQRLSLATRSDLSIEAQISAPGATWIDRQLLAKDPALSSGGFGAEVREAMDQRIDHLAQRGMAERQGQRIVFARDLISTLRRQELDGVASGLSAETGLPHRPSAEGEHVSGIYRQRITLSSGRFAMIDDGMGFQLVPWRPALEQQLGKQVAGVMSPGGGVDWNFGRKRGLGI